jgi:hypothetical protein
MKLFHYRPTYNSSGGVEFRDVPDAPAPDDSPAMRLRQMKSLAERFTTTLMGWNADNGTRRTASVASAVVPL